MTTNPYESPRGFEDEAGPTVPKPSDRGIGSLIVFVFATFGGGLVGIVIGNLLAVSLGLLALSGRHRGNLHILGINHFFSLVLLVVGSFVGGYVATRFTDRRRARGLTEKEPS